MKKLNKKVLDKCIEMTRQLWSGVIALDSFIRERQTVAKESGANWLVLLDLLDSILVYNGFKPEASNSEIYDILNMLGWEVVGEEIETSESV